MSDCPTINWFDIDEDEDESDQDPTTPVENSDDGKSENEKEEEDTDVIFKTHAEVMKRASSTILKQGNQISDLIEQLRKSAITIQKLSKTGSAASDELKRDSETFQ